MKFLIVMDALTVGGIGTAFKNYINYISEQVECDILIFNDIDINIEDFSKNVNIIHSNDCLRMLGMSQSRTYHYSKKLFILRMFFVLLARLTNGMISRKILFKFVPNCGDYDVAVSYPHDPMWRSLARGCCQYIIEKVNANTKAAYIHCDYKNFGGYNPKQIKLFKQLDRIICVSKSCSQNFSNCFPLLENKVITCENFTNVDDILNKALNISPKIYKKNIMKIVTVCRVSKEKGIDRAIEAFLRISKSNNDFLWTIVGDGIDYNKIKKIINAYGLSNNIRLVGEKKNPYPYIAEADVFFLPSYHEAAPMVFGECVTLGIPIISTDTCSANELIVNRQLGIVCDNSVEGIFDVLSSLINKTIDLESIRLNVKKCDVNYSAKKQFEEFLYYCENRSVKNG